MHGCTLYEYCSTTDSTFEDNLQLNLERLGHLCYEHRRELTRYDGPPHMQLTCPDFWSEDCRGCAIVGRTYYDHCSLSQLLVLRNSFFLTHTHVVKFGLEYCLRRTAAFGCATRAAAKARPHEFDHSARL